MENTFLKITATVFLLSILIGCSESEIPEIVQNNIVDKKEALPIEKIDYAGFISLADSLKEYRESRLIDEETFLQYSQDENTVILDTRSIKAFYDVHVKGAIHLNFSDFTNGKLQGIIPDKKTRILIYCNNNFESSRASMGDKIVRLALNIPTFINLCGYGYMNVYELSGYIKEEESKIPLVTLENTDYLGPLPTR